MKKFLKWSALIAVMSVLFAGCPDPNKGPGNGPGTGEEVVVTSITILVNGTQVANPPLSMYIGDTVPLSASILPGTATEKGYDFTLENNNGVLSLSGTTLSAVSEGQATIKVTSKGKDKDGNFLTKTLSVVVTENPEGITQTKLLVFNQNTNPDTATTTVLPALNADKRYVIVNNEDNATIPNAWADVKGNTIVYLNKPLKIQNSGTEEAPVYDIPFSISARVRITSGRNTSTALSGGNNGVITGVFTNPTLAVSATDPLLFVGIRTAWDGSKGMRASRDSDNSSTTLGGTNGTELFKADTAADKKLGFQEQEYVINVERTNSSTYTLSVYSADGSTLVEKNTRGSSTNQVNTKLQSADDYLYLGFIVSGVTVEISNVVVKDGTETVFQAATDATPFPVAIKKVNITTTATPTNADATYNYQSLLANFPGTGVQLNAQVLPTDAASQNVVWSMTPSTGGTFANGLVKITTAGAYTVKAQTTGTEFAEYKFNILAAAPDATEVHIAGHSQVEAGSTITLTANVLPLFSNQTVTWSVTASDGTSTTTAATIDATTGVLTGKTVSADTEVNVFATTANSVKSAAHLVTVKPSGSGPALPQIWFSNIGGATGGKTFSDDSTQITMPGTAGSLDTSNMKFSFVYLPAEGDFTMTVKVVSSTMSGGTTRAGIIGLEQDGVTQNTTTGELTGVSISTVYGAAGGRTNSGTFNWINFRTASAGTQNMTISGTTSKMDNFWFKLSRSGSTFSAYVSVDGTNWGSATNAAIGTLTSNKDVYLGIYSANAAATFTDLRFTGTSGGVAYTDAYISFDWLE